MISALLVTRKCPVLIGFGTVSSCVGALLLIPIPCAMEPLFPSPRPKLGSPSSYSGAPTFPCISPFTFKYKRVVLKAKSTP